MNKRGKIFVVLCLAVLTIFILSLISASDWAKFHNDLNNTGYQNETLGSNFNLVWNYSTGGAAYASPVVSDGVLFVGSYGGNNFFALNATNGSKIWNYSMSSGSIADAVVSNGVVYVPSYYGRVYALNETTGTQLWNYSNGIGFQAPLAIYNGIVYAPGTDGMTYAINATNGSKIWNTITGTVASQTAPAVYNGVVYLGSGDSHIYALNATNGSKIWNYSLKIGGSGYSPTAVTYYKGRIYFGSLDNNTYALNATTGAKIWKYTTGKYIQSAPAVHGDVVYFGSNDNKTYALNATTGAKIWSYDAAGAFGGSAPAISNNLVFIGNYGNHNLYALNAKTGSVVWNYTLGGAISSSPAIANGFVYVTSQDGKVYAFRNPTIPTLISPSDGNISYNLNQSFNVTESASSGNLLSAELYVWDANGNKILLPQGNMWIANYYSNSVTKIYPNGTMINYTGTGATPQYIAFDGSNMWTTNWNSNSVTKVYPNGTMINYTGTGASPAGIAFDGSNMWTANANDNSVTKIYPNGTMINYTGTGKHPVVIAFDGSNMWTANYYSNSVTKIYPNGTMINYTGTGIRPMGIAFDGSNIWTANGNSYSVTKIYPNGTMINYTGIGTPPSTMAFDGSNIWTANYYSNSVTKIYPNGTMINYTGTGATPQYIAFDGSNMWTANGNDDSVTKIYPNGTMINYTGTESSPAGIAFDGSTLDPLFNFMTKNFSGTSNQTDWTYTLPSTGKYYWNVKTCDDNGKCSFASQNRSFTISAQCGTVSECNAAIANAGPGAVIYMNQSINYPNNGTAINLTNVQNIIFDCNGFNLTGPNNGNATNYGIGLEYSDNIAVKNCNMSGFYYGVFMNYDNNSLVKDLSAISSGGIGIGILNGQNNSVDSCNSTLSLTGVYIYFSNYTSVSNIVSKNNSYGLNIAQSYYNNFTNIIANNNSQIGFFSQLHSGHNNFRNITASYNSQGFSQSDTAPTGQYNSFTDIKMINNKDTQILLDGSYSNITNAYLYNSTGYGIRVVSHSIVKNVTSVKNQWGIFSYSISNQIINSTMDSNSYGLYATVQNLPSFNLTGSVIKNSSIAGIYEVGAEANFIYNNLFNNTVNYYAYSLAPQDTLSITKTSGTNIINGSYIGGNYWANPSGTGYSQTCADRNRDGICDSSYTTPNGTIDYLPLDYPSTVYTATQCNSASSCNSAINAAYEGDTVQMNASITYGSGTAITINGINNLTFDCAGYSITGPNTLTSGNNGILVTNSNYTTIKNCKIGKFYSGINTTVPTYFANITNVTLSPNMEFGIHFDGSNSTISYVNASSNFRGLDFQSAYYIDISNSFFYNNTFSGIYIGASSYLNFNNITLRSNPQYGIDLQVSASYNNFSNINVDGSATAGIFSHTSGNRFENISGSGNKILMDLATSATNNNMTNITAYNSSQYGVYLGATGNRLIKSHIYNNSLAGIYATYSGNYVYDNVLNNTHNYYLSSVALTEYLNITKTSGTNIINGSYIGGNYWANPSGTGYSQTCADKNRDGICDSSYTTPNGTIDYLPLDYPKPIQTVQCDSVSSCNSAINSAAYGDTVELNTSLTGISTNGTMFIGINNITFDCMGNSIAGTGGSAKKYGIYFQGSNYTTIKNCNVAGFYYGIYLTKSSENNTIRDSNSSSNFVSGGAGIYLDSSNGNNIMNVTTNGQYYGIHLQNSNQTTIANCTANSGQSGFNFAASWNNHIINSSAYYNQNSGIDFFAGSSNNQVIDSITNSNLQYGIWMYLSSSNNTIINSTSNSNSLWGAYVNSANNTFSNFVSSNNGNSGSGGGIDLLVGNCTLINLTLSTEYDGISIAGNNNLVVNATIVNLSLYGISFSSSNNIVRDSTIINATTSGIYLTSSSNNNTFYNNLINSTVPYLDTSTGTNYLNTTLTSGTNIIGGSWIGGNYWDNFSAPGTGFSGICADRNKDGFCDSAYNPSASVYDYLPLDYPKPIQTVQCDSVPSCNAAIAVAGYGDTVELNTSLTGISTTAINLTNVKNITLNCLGNWINGTGAASTYGIYLSGNNYTTIKNCNVNNFNTGIGVISSFNNTLTNNTANSNGYRGIFLSSSSNNIVSNNTANLNIDGIAVYSGLNNTITNNTANSNTDGIYFSSGSNSTITKNTLSQNSQYGIYLSSSSYNTITRNNATSNAYGVEVYSSSNYNNLAGNTFSSNNYGITLVSSSNNTINNSTVSNSSIYGLQVGSSNYNLIYNNIFNNTVNYYNTSAGLVNYFNTTLQNGTNILGGSTIGGNFWDNYSAPGTGFSTTCSSIDGVCTDSYASSGIPDYYPMTYNSLASIANTANATANQTTTINISNSTLNSTMDLTQLNMVTKNNITNARVTVFRVNETSSTATITIGGKNLTSGKAYQAFQINPSGFNDSDISNVTIYFKVNKTWVSDNGLDANNITLYRNPGNGTWTALTTTLNTSDSDYYYFYAVSPGFSIYIIFVSSPYVPPSTNPTSPSGGAGGGGGIASNSTNETCTDGQKICTDGNVQICVLGTYTNFKTCEFGCSNGECQTQAANSTNSSAETSNTLTGISNFFNSITPAFFKQTTLGYVIYYFLLVLVVSGIVIVSFTLYKRTIGLKSNDILKEANRRKKRK